MEKINLENILKLSKENLKGKIIVFPTDTVYGVAALYLDSDGVEKIYQMKKRDYGKPLPVLCSSLKQVEDICYTNEKVTKYSESWPGALTIILNGKMGKTVAVRIPNSDIALEIINHFGPLSTTSVNYSGEKEINTVDEIAEKFSDFVDYLVTDDATLSKTPSTIIDCTNDITKVIRQGSVIINE